MENTRQFNPELISISRSASLIEKVHSCADCPIRKMVIKQPKSLFSRLHIWHKTWWPGWKAHEARLCALRTMAKTQA